jgi:hypothetical protein
MTGAPFQKMSKSQARQLSARDGRADGLVGSEVALERREEFVTEICGLWNDAKQRFLAIGRRLSEAYRKLGPEEYEAMIAKDLPFTMPIAHQLRAVAEAVAIGRLTEDRLPSSYATAYQITTLSDDELRMADERNLLHPKVARTEIIQFKRQVRESRADAIERARKLRRLKAERDRLLKRLRQIESEVAEMEGDDTADEDGRDLRGINLGSRAIEATAIVIDGTATAVDDEAPALTDADS